MNDEKLRMCYKKDYSDFVAIDIGNSRIKVLYRNEIKAFENTKLDNFKKYFTEIINTAEMAFKIYILKVCIASVNSNIENKILELLEPFDFVHIPAEAPLKHQKLIEFSLVPSMGVDRKIGLIGAYEHSNPPYITVDIGTAITINVVDNKFKCRGGVIFPGPYTQVKSLNEHTDGLGSIKLGVSPEVLGTNTITAVGNGIVYGICGAIKEIIGQIKSQDPGMANSKVIITGGGSKLIRWILKVMEFDFKYEEDLVVKGIFKLIRLRGAKHFTVRNENSVED